MVRWMGRSNPSIWVWIDARFGDWWYVFMWRKGEWPYMYRSKDATPPTDRNHGRTIFGRIRGY